MRNIVPRLRSVPTRVKIHWVAVMAAVLFGSSAVAESSPPNADSPLAQCESILRQGGALPPDLTQFERDVERLSAADVSEYLQYLRSLSPMELARFVEEIRMNAQYRPGPDSLPQPGIPSGKVFVFTLEHSKVFPGTTRKITVYVPAEYRGDKPACVYVGLDELGFEAPTVFDHLIAHHEMPVTIGIGIEPGQVDSRSPPLDPRYNRSVEFDGMSTQLADFVLAEVLPEVERHRTPDGLRIRLSTDPNDRAVGGASTGGIGAFTLAWERPDSFRRVFTAIGTFVGMRGGDRYAVLVRKTESKPIRIFMQDGSNDELTLYLGEMGDWWLGNQTMNSALEFAGYAVEHVWGSGSHNPKQATAVFPQAMRWLWQDWPKPVVAGPSQNVFLKAILIPGEGWQAAADEPMATRLASWGSREALGPAGRVYRTNTASGTVSLDRPGLATVQLDAGLSAPTAIALSPDDLWLAVAESKTHWGYSYRVLSDGTLADKQRFYWFYVPDEADDSGVGAWVADREGRLYAATRMGVQVFDRNGRVRAILPTPGGRATNVAFGGKNSDYLYVSAGDGKIYRRKLKVPGFPPGSAAIQLPPWGAG